MKTPRVVSPLRLLPWCLTGLTAAVALRAQSPVPATGPTRADAPVVLSPFMISTDADDGYAATESASASRFKQNLKDIPQSIAIMSGQFLKDIGAIDLADVMPLIGGTVAGGTRQQDAFSIRGFAVQESYLDGFRDVVEWGGGDFVHVQQLEVIKGPSTNLYANPKGLGGIINRVSKAPLARPARTLALTLGDYANYHLTADVTGPIDAAKTVRYRVNAAFRSLEYNRDFKKLERVFVAPTLTWQATPATKLTFYSEFMRQEHQEDNWIPSVVNPTTGLRELTVPDTRRIDEPWANSLIEKESFRLMAEHQINPYLTARVVGQGLFINNPIRQVEFVSLAANNRTVNRQAFWLNRWAENSYAEANLFGRFKQGALEHSFILAADASGFFGARNRVNVRRVPLAASDLLEPTYATPEPAFPATAAVTNTLGEGTSSGYSGTYQLNAYEGRVILLGGLRHSAVDSTSVIELGPQPFAQSVASTKADNPRYGAIVRPIKPLALYYQYSETFQPQAGGALRLDGSALAPVTGTSEEFGVRLSLLNEKLNFEAVKYEMQADGLAVRLPPPNQSFFANGGQTTSDGYEYTVTYHGGGLTLQAGWVDVFVRDTTPGVIGAQQGGQPRYRGVANVRYRWPKLGGHGGLAIGGGVVHTGDRPLSATTVSQKIPAFEYYSFNANYAVAKGLTLAVAVGNVFNERAVIANNGILWRPLDPRTLRFTLTKSW